MMHNSSLTEKIVGLNEKKVMKRDTTEIQAYVKYQAGWNIQGNKPRKFKYT